MNLHEYDYVVINTSGGKDSMTMMGFVMALVKEQGYPVERVIAAHADLGRIEWQGAKELAEEHARHFGIRFWWMARPQGDLLEHIIDRGMWPDSGNRYCTSDHKRDQVSKLFTEVVKQLERPKGSKPVRILNCLGMRAEESPARSKLPEFRNDKRNTNTLRVVDTWHPILGWTVQQVWAWIKASGLRWHHAYDLGMPRLSCMFCVFAPKEALMIAGKANPELLADYVSAERTMGHTFRNGFKIESVQQAIERGEDWGRPANWVM